MIDDVLHLKTDCFSAYFYRQQVNDRIRRQVQASIERHKHLLEQTHGIDDR